ncbi:unnamed protein product [Cuscuta europaea]|uniref:Uncharacterized protein n=1 Tax=Cuscuta europaea TaxID=41803 RepID=A0A9P0YXQ0_CUSEU|nr:unnamed protein product [Cuscuta europaea]
MHQLPSPQMAKSLPGSAPSSPVPHHHQPHPNLGPQSHSTLHTPQHPPQDCVEDNNRCLQAFCLHLREAGSSEYDHRTSAISGGPQIEVIIMADLEPEATNQSRLPLRKADSELAASNRSRRPWEGRTAKKTEKLVGVADVDEAEGGGLRS